MDKNNQELIVPNEIIMDKIYLIRGEKVMLGHDLAKLYGVETKQLEQVKQEELEHKIRGKIGFIR